MSYSSNAIHLNAIALGKTTPTHGFLILYIMSYQVKKERRSKFLERLRSLFKGEERFIEPLAFAREYGGSLQMQSVGGMYKVSFVSVDKRAHAWGGSLRVAYENMVRMFEEKYGV